MIDMVRNALATVLRRGYERLAGIVMILFLSAVQGHVAAGAVCGVLGLVICSALMRPRLHRAKMERLLRDQLWRIAVRYRDLRGKHPEDHDLTDHYFKNGLGEQTYWVLNAVEAADLPLEVLLEGWDLGYPNGQEDSLVRELLKFDLRVGQRLALPRYRQFYNSL